MLLMLLLALPVGAQEAQQQAELAEVRRKITELQTTLRKERGREGVLEQRLRESERRIGDEAKLLAELEHRLKLQKQELRRLTRERKAQQQVLDEQQELLAGQIRAAYAMGRQEQIKLLLNQQDPAKVGRVLVYYDYFNRARTERIELIDQTLRRIGELEISIRDQRQILASTKESQAVKVQRLQASKRERQQVLKQLRAAIKTKDQQLAKFQGDEQRLLRLLNSIQEAVKDIPMEEADRHPFATLKGRLPWPVRGKVAARFGTQRVAGTLRWRGMMINSKEGRQIKAISHGRVVYADWLRGFGLLTIVDHGDGFMSLYGHSQSLFKELGDWVEPGEVIATVGDSGGQNQTGLYFEIRREGKPVNPVAWCKGKRPPVS